MVPGGHRVHRGAKDPRQRADTARIRAITTARAVTSPKSVVTAGAGSELADTDADVRTLPCGRAAANCSGRASHSLLERAGRTSDE